MNPTHVRKMLDSTHSIVRTHCYLLGFTGIKKREESLDSNNCTYQAKLLVQGRAHVLTALFRHLGTR